MLPVVLALLLNNAAAAESLTVKRVAVLQFETAHIGASGLIASDLFGVFLQQNFPGISVVERTRLERVLSEQQLEYHSGLVDRETAAQLQRLLGVDSVVIGRIVALDLEAEGGAGALMMTARLVDTSSGRILWAETRTVRVRPGFMKRALRGLTSGAGESDALVTNKLIEKASFELVQDLGLRLSRDALEPDHAAVALRVKEAGGNLSSVLTCESAEARVTELGRSILSEESLYWAHRIREERSFDVTPGRGYPTEDHRQRLATKILFWLGEKDLPPLTEAQTIRIVDAKTQMKGLMGACGAAALARLAGPPSPGKPGRAPD